MLSLPDSALLQGTITDSVGCFTLSSDLPPERLLFRLGLMGCKSRILPPGATYRRGQHRLDLGAGFDQSFIYSLSSSRLKSVGNADSRLVEMRPSAYAEYGWNSSDQA